MGSFPPSKGGGRWVKLFPPSRREGDGTWGDLPPQMCGVRCVFNPGEEEGAYLPAVQ